MAAVQDDSSSSKTMAARAASDAGEAFVKVTCDRLELLIVAGLYLISVGFSTVAGAPFFKRQPIAGRRHHATTNCGKLVTERPMRSPLPVCADPARKCRGLDDASTSHEQVGLCAMHCLLCNACPACDGDVVLLNALLCVHGAHACILFCGVLLMLA